MISKFVLSVDGEEFELDEPLEQLGTERNTKKYIAVIDGKKHEVKPGTLNGKRIFVLDEWQFNVFR